MKTEMKPVKVFSTVMDGEQKYIQGNMSRFDPKCTMSRFARLKKKSVLLCLILCVSAGCRQRKKPEATDCSWNTSEKHFSFRIAGTPPRLEFGGSCPKDLPLESGSFRYLRPEGLLEGTVSLKAGRKSPGRGGMYLAVIDALALEEGDRRFQPQINSRKSWVTFQRERGFLHVKPGVETQWSFVLPGGPTGPVVYGRGRVIKVESARTARIWQPEDNLAGLRPSESGDSGWSWEQHTDGITGWGRVCGHKAEKPLRTVLPARLPGSKIRGYSVWSRRRVFPAKNIRVTRGTLSHDERAGSRAGWHFVGMLNFDKDPDDRPAVCPEGKGPVVEIIGPGIGCIDALGFVPEPDQVKEPRTKDPGSRRVSGADKFNAPPHPPGIFGSKAQRSMLPNLLRKNLIKSAARTKARTAEIETREEWEQRVVEIRANLKKALDFPEPRNSAPHIRTRGKVEGDGFEVEKMFVEATEGMWASALLYKPSTPPPPGGYPALLHILGHYGPGKHRPAARTLGASMARSGWMVLAVDCLSFGERRGPAEREIENHHYMGFWNFMAGSSPARIIYGENLRFLEYLLYHPQVDSDRVAVTGSSGGGTGALYLAALDERVKGAAIVAAVSTWEHFGNFVGGDPEQFPRHLTDIADFSTLLAAVAPRPLLVAGGAKDDLFPASEGKKSVERASHIYKLLGGGDNIVFAGDGKPHGYPAPRRKAVYGFLHKKLGDRARPIVDSPQKALPAESLRTGRTPDNRTLLDHARESVNKERNRVQKNDPVVHRKLIKDRLNWSKGLEIPFSGFQQRGEIGEFGGRVGITIDGDVEIPGRLHVPDGVLRGGVVYITDSGDAASAFTAEMLGRGIVVLSVDLSGRGILTPNRRGRYGLRRNFRNIDKALYIEEFFAAAYTLAQGDSLWGMRQRELRTVVSALAEFGGFNSVGVVGQGPESSVYALAAGALDKRVGAVMGINGPLSLDRIMAARGFPPSGLVAADALVLMDIPDLILLNGSKPVKWITGDRAAHRVDGGAADGDLRKKLHDWLDEWILKK